MESEWVRLVRIGGRRVTLTAQEEIVNDVVWFSIPFLEIDRRIPMIAIAVCDDPTCLIECLLAPLYSCGVRIETVFFSGRVRRASAVGRSAKADALLGSRPISICLFRSFHPRVATLPRRYAPEHVTSCDLSEFLDTMNACDMTIAICSVQCKRFDGFWHNSQILEGIAMGIRSGDIPVS